VARGFDAQYQINPYLSADTGITYGNLWTATGVLGIGAESSAESVTIPFDDLPIGACALERGYAVTTRNPRHLGKNPA